MLGKLLLICISIVLPACDGFGKTELETIWEFHKLRNLLEKNDLTFLLTELLGKLPSDIQKVLLNDPEIYTKNDKRIGRILNLFNEDFDRKRGIKSASIATTVFNTTVTTPIASTTVTPPVTNTVTNTAAGTVSTPIASTNVTPPVTNTAAGTASTPIASTTILSAITNTTASPPITSTTVGTPLTSTNLATPILKTTAGAVTPISKTSFHLTTNSEKTKSTRTPISPKTTAAHCDVACTISNLLNSFNITLSCGVHTTELILNFVQSISRDSSNSLSNPAWSWKVLDSMGKLGPGVLQGNLALVGSKSECESIVTTSSDFVLKYAYAVFKLPNFNDTTNVCPQSTNDLFNPSLTTLRVGVCIPSTCTNEDSTRLMNFATALLLKSTNCGVFAYEREIPFTTGAIVMLSLLGFTGVLILFGTLYDYFSHQPIISKLKAQSDHLSEIGHKQQDFTLKEYEQNIGLFIRALLSFSFYSNAKSVLNTEQKPGQILCVHGIRLFSMCWVIMGHSYQTAIISDNVAVPLTTLPNQLFTLTITNANFSVDSFFVLSGLLVSYLWFKEVKKHPKRIKRAYYWIMYYVHRYIRLTPVYAIVILSYTYLTPHMSDGMLPQTMDYPQCRDNFWANMLYINNLYKPNNMCYTVSWYLANDMQFYVMAPLLLIPLLYFPIYGIITWSMVCFGSMAGYAYTIYYYHLGTNVLGAKIDPVYKNMTMTHDYSGETWYDAKEDIDWDMSYVAPWVRFIPYVIGMFLGYILALYRTFKINRYINIVVWLVVLITGLSIVYGIYGNANGHVMQLGVRMLYLSVSRPLWALCVSWVVFSCHYGYGGWINQFLSWHGWIPLSRLTYCAYLLHIMVEYLLVMNMGRVIHWNGHFNWLTEHTLPLIVCGYIAAFVVTCSFEIPLLTLEKLILPRERATVSVNQIIHMPSVVTHKDSAGGITNERM